MKSLVFLAIIACVCTPLSAATPASKWPELAGLEAMPQRDRVDVVLALLDERDRQLANFDYTAWEVCNNVRVSDGNRRFMKRDRYEVRRLGPKYWMHLTNYEYYTQDTIRADSTMNWDGKLSRGFVSPPYLHTTYPQGRIDAVENDNFRDRKVNELLGLWVQTTGDAAVPISVFLRDGMRHGDQIDVAPENGQNGQSGIRVNIRRLYDRWTFRLDAAHGYMISRFEHSYEYGGAYNRSWEEVQEARSATGVWVPTRAIRRTGTSAYPEESEFQYTLDRFSIGGVRESDMDVVFPAGSKIVDSTRNIAFFVLNDGTYKLLPLADSRSHLLHVPPSNAVISNLDGAVAKYSTEKLIFADAEKRLPRTLSAWRKAALAITAVTGAMVLALLLRRRVSRVTANIK